MSRIRLKPLVVGLLATLLAFGIVFDVITALRIYRYGWVVPPDEFFALNEQGRLIYRTYTESESRPYFQVVAIFLLVQLVIAAYLWTQWRRKGAT